MRITANEALQKKKKSELEDLVIENIQNETHREKAVESSSV